MKQKYESGSAKGQSGDSESQDPRHIGWMERVAHPDSPAGGGGPGGFSQKDFGESKGISLPRGKTNDSSYVVPMNTDQPKPPNAPPATQPKSLGKLMEENTDFWDISIDAELKADGKSSGAIETGVGKPASKSPAYDTDGKGKITAFKGKFVWRGTIDIQTVYPSGVTARDLTCYGRGTTPKDVEDRNITLGFHEHQHQLDYISYLTTHPLPEPPALELEMSVTDFNKETTRFSTELDEYWAKMEADTVTKTDEVGHKKSTWAKQQTCYEHLLPAED